MMHVSQDMRPALASLHDSSERVGFWQDFVDLLQDWWSLFLDVLGFFGIAL